MTEYSTTFKANMVKKLMVPGGADGVGALGPIWDLTTDVVEMAPGCER